MGFLGLHQFKKQVTFSNSCEISLPWIRSVMYAWGSRRRVSLCNQHNYGFMILMALLMLLFLAPPPRPPTPPMNEAFDHAY